MILHFKRFGINIDDWPAANEDGSYPNDDEGNTEKAEKINEMITDEDVDPDTDEPDAGEMCEADYAK
jgi:hypothetical protein